MDVYDYLIVTHCCLSTQAVCIIQTLDDAEALLFLDKNFNELFNRMPADEVAAVCKRELSRLSQVGCVWLLPTHRHTTACVYVHVVHAR